jgi:hypothetical protein
MEQLWKFPFLNLRDGQGIARDEIGIRGRHTPRRKPVRGAELGGGQTGKRSTGWFRGHK